MNIYSIISQINLNVKVFLLLLKGSSFIGFRIFSMLSQLTFAKRALFSTRPGVEEDGICSRSRGKEKAKSTKTYGEISSNTLVSRVTDSSNIWSAKICQSLFCAVFLVLTPAFGRRRRFLSIASTCCSANGRARDLDILTIINLTRSCFPSRNISRLSGPQFCAIVMSASKR